MRIQIRLTDYSGNIFEGHVALTKVPKKENAPIKSARQSIDRHAPEMNFSLNERAFMKKYAKQMSGSQKFTLLLARLAGGKIDQVIPGDQVASHWNRMKNVLGSKFNGAHATRAKEAGWVNSPKWAHYSLSSSWKEILIQ